MSSLGKLLNLEEVAEYLGVVPGTIYYWRCYGKPCPPAIKVGKFLKWREADVTNWVQAQAEKAAA